MERATRGPLGGTGMRNFGGSDCGAPPLDANALHVWTWNLDVDRGGLSRYEEVLSADEWRRVGHYASRLPACRFIVRRGMLRRIVSRYVDQQPRNVRFEYNPHGKPILATELAAGLQFNLSDSGDLAALAICLQQPVGIDIEQLRPPPTPVAGGLESYSLAPRELEHFERVPEPERSLRFLRAWTRREAIVKAEGVGLQLLTGQLELEELADHQEPAWEEGGVHCKRGFHLYCLTLPDGYVGSSATRQKLLDIRYFSPA